MSDGPPAAPAPATLACACLVAATAGFVAALGLVGADAVWAVPLGRLVAHGTLPSSVPFASAPTSGWHDVPAGGELLLWAAYRVFGGYRGLVVAQTVAAAVAFAVLAAGLRRETRDRGVLLVCLVVLIGALPSVAVASLGGASLAGFSLLLLLLHDDARRGGRRVWLAVPLLALWGNLHGGVLAGWGLLLCSAFLARGDRRVAERIALAAAGTLALFANPALWRTPLYYRGVFENEAARHGSELWARLGTGGFDLVLLAAALALATIVAAGRPRVALWELVALAGLAVATVHVARSGVWFLLVAAYPAARALRLPAVRPSLLALTAGVLAVGAVASLALEPHEPGSDALAARAARTRQPVLATSLLGEQVAAHGGRVWVSNPIDAFRRPDQRLYLDWLAGRPAGAGAVAHARYVLVAAGSPPAAAAASDRRLTLVARDAGAALYRIRGPG